MHAKPMGSNAVELLWPVSDNFSSITIMDFDSHGPWGEGMCKIGKTIRAKLGFYRLIYYTLPHSVWEPIYRWSEPIERRNSAAAHYSQEEGSPVEGW